mmetsp:Transcript_53204/g.137634  ORF Transcript_53204/g.137634 Transcript_53204/m.137634 type:complete len:212 (-) Transcript_53204:282-917(-)
MLLSSAAACVTLHACSEGMIRRGSDPCSSLAIRQAIITDARDEAAFRQVVASQERTYWPGWEERRVLSVRWNTWADVAILVATEDQPMGLDDLVIVGTAEVIGPLAASSPLPERCLLRDVWVAESYRRQGIASRLIGAAEALVQEKNQCSCVSLEVQGENQAAMALYERAGYTEVGGDSPADQILSPLAPLVKSLPGWMRGTVVLTKNLEG